MMMPAPYDGHRDDDDDDDDECDDYDDDDEDDKDNLSSLDARHATCYPRAGVLHVTLGARVS